MDLTILQLNAQGSKEVASDLRKNTERLVDIIVLQEPYSLAGRIKGYAELKARIYHPNVNTPKVAIIVKNPNLDVLQLKMEDTKHVAAIQVIAGTYEFYLISAYFQFSHPVEPYLEVLDRCINRIKSKKANSEIVICADVNALSTSWFSRSTNERGDLVEDFIMDNNLIVINKKSEHTTYASPSGTSNIDITLATTGIAKYIKDWCVSPDLTISDHNAILFKISSRDVAGIQLRHDDLSFNLNKANWKLFEAEVRRIFNPFIKKKIEYLPAQDAVALVTTKLQEICKKTIGIRRYRARTVPWWNDKLTALRKKVQAARSQLNRVRRLSLNDLEQAKNRHKKYRAEYVKEIRKSKMQSWQRFITEKGNEDPWGIVYKILRNKIRNDFNTFHSIGEGNDSTVTWRDTAGKLLDKMVPTDDNVTDTDRHNTENEIKNYVNYNLEPLISVEEIEIAIKRIKNKKAPGMDGINPEIVKTLWKTDKDILLKLFNSCLKESSFPESWRQARLRPILKDIQKDPASVNSYRPIALLSVMGKLYERIIVNRIQNLYEEQGLSSNTQFGFRSGRGTDDALNRVVSLTKSSETKYVVSVFFDIAGAFDNLWWPAILKRVTKAQCSLQLFGIIKQYFSKRKMILTSRYDKIAKEMTKGCPQGSIIGPLAWNWSMDELLNQLQTLETEKIYATAYADDLALIICEDSRTKIEEKACKAIETICSWCVKYKLRIAIEKTKAILIRGNFHQDRMPKMIIYDKKIKFVNEYKYLGIYLDRKLSFMPHVQYLKNKIMALSGILRRSIQDEWGLKRKACTLLYKCLYVPVIVYGAIVWFERTSHSHIERSLNSIQRKLLMPMSRACRTSSTAAMQVIMGCMPIKLEIIQKALITKARKKELVVWNTYRFNPEEDLSEKYLKEEKKKLKLALCDQWQKEWNNNTHGRTTYKFIEDVSFADKNYKWFKPNKACVDIITGYGSINKTLFERNCVESPKCPKCPNEDENIEHILFQCSLYSHIRPQNILEHQKQETWNGILKDEISYKEFCNFAIKVFKIRKEFLRKGENSSSPPPRG